MKFSKIIIAAALTALTSLEVAEAAPLKEAMAPTSVGLQLPPPPPRPPAPRFHHRYVRHHYQPRHHSTFRIHLPPPPPHPPGPPRL